MSFPQSLHERLGSPVSVDRGPIMGTDQPLTRQREIELRCPVDISLARYLIAKPTCSLDHSWYEFSPKGYHHQSRIRMSREAAGWGRAGTGTATLTYKSIRRVRKLTDSLALYVSDEHSRDIEFDRAKSMLGLVDDLSQVSSRARYVVSKGHGIVRVRVRVRVSHLA